MRIFQNLKVATKIAALLFFLGVLLTAVSLFGSTTVHRISDGYRALVEQKLPATTDLARANRRAIELPFLAAQALAYDPGSPQVAKLSATLERAYARGGNNLRDALATDPAFAEVMPALRRDYDAVHDHSAAALALAMAGARAEAQVRLAAADRHLEKFADAVSETTYARVDEGDARTAELIAAVEQRARQLVLASLALVVLGLALAFWIARVTIARPLNRLQQGMVVLAAGETDLAVAGTDRRDEVGDMARAVLVFRDAVAAQKTAAIESAAAAEAQRQVVDTLGGHLEAVARGDLTVNIDAKFPPAYAALRNNFNDALASLRELIASVVTGAEALRGGSNEIAGAASDLSRRTQENAASIEETSAAIGQMDVRLRDSAGAATETVQSASQAIRTVDDGRSVANGAKQAMERVSESAKGIDAVIEGLDKIAFQTRVLAMNAAVEAGRAGEAGRGFAVVADLVSALAMRAEEEAKRARDQLTVTQSDIGSAVDAVMRVDGALADITTDVSKVNALLESLASDNKAQASAITEISSAVENMDRSTQHNAAMVEETSAAAQYLNEEVNLLAARAAAFRISGEGAASLPMRVSAAPQPAQAKQPSQPVPSPAPDAPAPTLLAKFEGPIRPLPPEAVNSLTRRGDDWTEF